MLAAFTSIAEEMHVAWTKSNGLLRAMGVSGPQMHTSSQILLHHGIIADPSSTRCNYFQPKSVPAGSANDANVQLPRQHGSASSLHEMQSSRYVHAQLLASDNALLSAMQLINLHHGNHARLACRSHKCPSTLQLYHFELHILHGIDAVLLKNIQEKTSSYQHGHASLVDRRNA